jgi:hypothetical protein
MKLVLTIIVKYQLICQNQANDPNLLNSDIEYYYNIPIEIYLSNVLVSQFTNCILV